MKSKDFYKSAAWKWFRKYMMLKYAKESNGTYFVQCATSGKYLVLPDKNTHLGHFIKVYEGNNTYFATAFNEQNVLPQCAQDNTYLGGKQMLMAKAIDKIHGSNTSNNLYIQSKNICKLGKFELDLIAKEYKKKFEELVKIKDNPWKNK